MVRLGRTYGNLMVGVRPTNSKLRDRAEGLVVRITGCDTGGRAREVLQQCAWNVRTACLCLMRDVDPRQAADMLDAAGGSLREALAEDRGATG
jgi:N-acetylmuramic acid 6-phosphate etherase